MTLVLEVPQPSEPATPAVPAAPEVPTTPDDPGVEPETDPAPSDGS
jgi:hypothetical protein